MKDPLPDIVAQSLDAIERGEMTIEECLAPYPQHRQELGAYLSLASQIRAAPTPPAPRFLRNAARASLMAQVASAEPVTFWERIRQKYMQRIANLFSSRRYVMTWLSIPTTLTNPISLTTVKVITP